MTLLEFKHVTYSRKYDKQLRNALLVLFFFSSLLQLALIIMMNDNKSNFQLELDNAFLSQQNEHLNKELCLARYTINALKGITTQKEEALNETRLELEKALQHIQLLTVTLKSKHNSIDFDNELSDDLSEEEELLVERRSIDIMSKLPLRPYLIHNENNNIYDDTY